MTAAFGGTDVEGLWDWKSAYDACEAAEILFLRKYGGAILMRAAPSTLMLIDRLAKLLPTHTRRSETAQAFQQFSTPPGLAFGASVAASLSTAQPGLGRTAGRECGKERVRKVYCWWWP